MIRAATTIARVTFSDATRAPAYGILLTLVLVLQALSPSLAMFGFGQESALMKEFAVSTMLLAGAVLAGLSATQVVYRELNSGAGEALLAKPVSPGAWVCGKFAGLAVAWTAAAYLMSLVLLLAARQGPPQRVGQPWDGPVAAAGLAALSGAAVLSVVLGRRARGRFGQAFLVATSLSLSAAFLAPLLFDSRWRLRPFGPGFDSELLDAALLAYFGGLVLQAAALLFAQVLGRGCLPATLLVFAVGLAWGGSPRVWLAWLPSLKVFWVGATFYRTGDEVPASYVIRTALYALSYAAVCMVVGTFLLRLREVGTPGAERR